MLKMRVPTLADIQNFKFHFTEAKIQKLKTAFRKFVGYSVIISILGVDIAYAMEEERGSTAPTAHYRRLSDSDKTTGGARGYQSRTTYEGFNGEEETNGVALVDQEPDKESHQPLRDLARQGLSADIFGNYYTPPPIILPGSLVAKGNAEGSIPEEKPLTVGSSSSSDEDSGESGSSNSSPTGSPRKDKEKKEDLEVTSDHKGTLLIGGERVRLSKLKEWLLANFDPEVSIFTEGGEDTKKGRFLSNAKKLKKKLFHNTEGYVPFEDEDVGTSNGGGSESSDDESEYTQDSPPGTNIPLQNMGGNESSSDPLLNGTNGEAIAVDGLIDIEEGKSQAFKENETDSTILHHANKLFRAISKKRGPEYIPSQDANDPVMKKARALAQAIEGTTLEKFGSYFKKHILDNTFTWKQWASLFPALVMAGGTGAAMSLVVLGSLYSTYYTPDISNPDVLEPLLDFSRYINASTGLHALLRVAPIMTDATSSSIGKLTTPKTWLERTADWTLIPTAMFLGIFLVLYVFELEQHNKEVSDVTGYWNQYDQYFYFSSIGFLPYLVTTTWAGMRGAIHRHFHRETPPHVQDRVNALRQLSERVDYELSDFETDELYTMMRSNPFEENASKLKNWANYCFLGQTSKPETLDGLLTYMCLTKYAQAEMMEEAEELRKCDVKKHFSRVAAGVASPAGFGLIAITMYELFNIFTGGDAALAISLTISTIGFLSSAFLQSSSLEKVFEDVWEGIGSFKKRAHFFNTLKDPYAWVKGLAATVCYTYGFAQNTFTSSLPILVLLAYYLPLRFAELVGGDKTETATAGVMLGVATPFLLNDIAIGTNEIGEIMMSIPRYARSAYHKVSDFVVTNALRRDPFISSHRKRRWIKQKIKETIAFNETLSPDVLKKVKVLEDQLASGKDLKQKEE
ncbi:MAG: hypothetical protein BGO67_05105 [Alphaproteobacteria bacterium 41-28]|nr:MAG: hypothetical protein BGO67_05105 [Alphaproteobacteria bacterium 41-28]